MNALQLSLQRLHRKRKQQIRRSVSEDCRKNEVNEDSNSKITKQKQNMLKAVSEELIYGDSDLEISASLSNITVNRNSISDIEYDDKEKQSSSKEEQITPWTKYKDKALSPVLRRLNSDPSTNKPRHQLFHLKTTKSFPTPDSDIPEFPTFDAE